MTPASAVPPPLSPPLVHSPREHDASTSYVDMHHWETTSSHSAVELDRRQRFLSDAERLIAEHPIEARESLASLDAMDTKHWHTLSAERVERELDTSLDAGLTTAKHATRLAEYGPNALEDEPRAPLYIIFLLQFYNLIIGILFLAAIASYFLGKNVEATAILIIVTINAIVATAQENQATNALEALAELSSPLCTVVRDGVQNVVESKSLVPGDVVVLMTGDIVPADVRLIHSVDLKVNEMLLTGESEDVAKKFNAPLTGAGKKLTADNMIFSSTTVTAGNARGVVVETGMSTRVGSIAALLKSNAGGDDSEKRRSLNPAAPVPRQVPAQDDAAADRTAQAGLCDW
ncbi:hypothetical protein PINS_up002656 [Pythium insidiosum]|nr:hypothetical protein PINS_up002656 [Pythium insidiosum]